MECWTDLEHPTGETQMAFAGRKDERDRQGRDRLLEELSGMTLAETTLEMALAITTLAELTLAEVSPAGMRLDLAEAVRAAAKRD
jgi:hypothetical protein